jgi:hypothetical protein
MKETSFQNLKLLLAACGWWIVSSMVLGEEAGGRLLAKKIRASNGFSSTNVLIPIRRVATKSNQPPAKCVRITLCPVHPYEALHFPEADLARNQDRTVPGVP